MQDCVRQNSGELLSRRYPMLAWLAFFLCFVFFPLFLIDSLIDRIQVVEKNRLRLSIEERLEDVLDYIEHYRANEKFAHKILKQSFQRINSSDNPLQKLAEEKQRINSTYPDVFFFVGWDKNGKIIKNLSDEDSYKYILNETFKFFNELSGMKSRVSPGVLAGENNFLGRLKLIRHYIGRLVRPDKLILPLLEDHAAASLLAEPYGQKFHLWYRMGENLSLMCFIDRKFFENSSSVNFALERLKKLRPDVDSGVCFFPVSKESLVRFNPLSSDSEVVVALSRFENLHPGQFLLQNGRYYAYRFIDADLRAICSISAKHLQPGWSKASVIAAVGRVFIVIVMVLLVYSLRIQKLKISVSMKLAGLFIYAGGLPLMIAMMIGVDYFSQKESRLAYASHKESLEQLRIIDEGFERFLSRKNKKFEKVLQGVVLNEGFTGDQKSLVRLCGAFEKTMLPESIVVFDREGKNRASVKLEALFSDVMIIGQLCSDVLSFWNSSDPSSADISDIARPLAVSMSYDLGTIKPLALGEHNVFSCYQVLGSQKNKTHEAMIFLFWRPEVLQAQYLREIIAERHDLIAFFPSQMKTLGALKDGNLVSQILVKASKLSVIRSTVSAKDGQNYLLSAMKGAKLNMATLAMIVPEARITQALRQTGIRLLGYALVFLLVAFGSVVLVRQRLIEPLHDFKGVIEGIGQRNFRRQSKIEGNNEFGAMAAALNKTLENFHELEIARIVQENLLPGKSFRLNNIEALARTEQMLQIGGDYYDFFKVSETQCGFFVGDVSGHGISSALYMAMARAAIILQSIDEFSLNSGMEYLNHIFFESRSAGNKEYMTGVMLLIDSVSGEFSLLNCGHCPPVILRSSTGACEQVKCGGLPFGFRQKLTTSVVNGRLFPGDSIFLYTDGWVESESSSGKVMGYSGFYEMITKNHHSGLESIVDGLYRDLHAWQPVQDDDLTILAIRKSGQSL